MGRTPRNKIVIFEGDERHIGEVFDVADHALERLHALRRPGDFELNGLGEPGAAA